MKAQILEKLDDEIAKAEKELTPMNPKYYSNLCGYWEGLLEARKIVLTTPEEGVKHG